MKIYLDLIIFINFIFDFLLLMTVNNILRRNVKIYKLIIGSLVGGLSILFLFIPMNSFSLFVYKVIISIVMVIFTFHYKNFKYFIKNMYYLYTSSIILGGFLYLLNIDFSYQHIGIVFINNGLSINYIFLIIISPIIILTYIKQIKELKNSYSNYNTVKIIFKNDLILNLIGYVDSGNNLTYNKKPIIIVKNKKLNKIKEYFLIPYTTLNNSGMLKCVIPKKVFINNTKIKKKVIVGISKNNISMDGVDCILHKNMIGEDYVK